MKVVIAKSAVLFLIGEGDVKSEYLAAVFDQISATPTRTDFFEWVIKGQDIETIAKGTVLTLLAHKSLTVRRAKILVKPILEQKDDRRYLDSYHSAHPLRLTHDYVCGVTLGLIQAASRSEENVAIAIFKLVVEIAFSEADKLAVLYPSSGNPDSRRMCEKAKSLEQTYYRKAIAECTKTIDVLSLLPACRLAQGKYQAGQRPYYFGEMLIHRMTYALQSDLTECAFRRNMMAEHLGWIFRHPSVVRK